MEDGHLVVAFGWAPCLCPGSYRAITIIDTQKNSHLVTSDRDTVNAQLDM